MTESKPQAAEIPPLRIEPYRHLAGFDHMEITSGEDIFLFDEDQEEGIIPLYSFLAQPGLPWMSDDMWVDVPGEKDDPISAGKHFFPVPQRDALNGFTFSKVYALPKETAETILESRSDLTASERKKFLARAFTAGPMDRKYVPIGYGTLKGTFGRLLDFAEGAEDLTEEEQDPSNYRLWVEPAAFFIRREFRGRKFGYLAGAALASPIASEIWHLHSMSETFGLRTGLTVEVYAEIHSFGGNAAVKGFLSGLTFTTESMPLREEGASGLYIAEFIDDVSW